MTHSILLLNGPNLNLLGTREPGIYGADTLKDVEANAAKTAKAKGAKIECFQSNHEGMLIDKIHEARGKHQAIIINPGAFTHTSVAIRDALSAVSGFDGLTGKLTCGPTGDCATGEALGIYQITDAEVSDGNWPPAVIWTP